MRMSCEHVLLFKVHFFFGTVHSPGPLLLLSPAMLYHVMDPCYPRLSFVERTRVMTVKGDMI